MCAKGGQGPARALKQSHNHRTASADGPKCRHRLFSLFFAPSQKPSHHVHRVHQNSSAETIEHVSALPRAELKSKAETNTSAPATSNRRTTSSNRRIKNTEKSENCGEPLLWFGALSLPDTHSHDWAQIFRRQAPTARELRPYCPEKKLQVFRKRDASTVQ